MDGRTAWIIGTGVTGLRGGVNVNDARAISWSLLALKAETVIVHLGKSSSQQR